MKSSTRSALRNHSCEWAILVAAILLGMIALAALLTGTLLTTDAERGSESHATPEGSTMPGLSQTTLAELVNLYGRAMDDVNEASGRALARLAENPSRRSSQFVLNSSIALQNQIADRLAALGVQVDRKLTPALVLAQTRSITAAERQTAALLGVGIENRAIEKLAEDSAAIAARDILGSMSLAAEQHAQNAVSVFRRLGPSEATGTTDARAKTERAVNTAIARGLIAGNPRLIERGVREGIGAGMFTDAAAMSYRKLGNQIIQVGGATLSVRAYASTVARTRSAEAANDAALERMDEHGIEAFSIEGATSANFCTAFIGLVVGIHGPITFEGRTYPGIESLPEGGAPFHPNCSKEYAPFDFELSSPARIERASQRHELYERRRDSGTLRERIAA